MRSLRLFHIGLRLCSFRHHASYDTAILTHADMQTRYGQDKTERDELELLELTEVRIAKWRLNKWEFRISPLLNGNEKEKAMLQQDILKSLCITQSKLNESIASDLNTVQAITGADPDSIRRQTRAWLQDEASKLRWKGEINKAKVLRDAFLRLEVYGSRDHRVLERLCCIYGLGLQGTFEDAFSNTICQDPQTGRFFVDESNVFRELLSCIVTRYPHIDMIYDFLGFNPLCGYRPSLRRFLTDALKVKHNLEEASASGRILFHSPSTKEILFDFGDSRASITSDDSVYGLPDFLYIKNTDFFLITIASENHWLRSRQVPHAKQLEGIGRRGSFVLGIPYDRVRIRNVLLPPAYLDRDSLLRLAEAVIDLSLDDQKKIMPWLPLYDKELDTQDVDFCELAKTINEDEWLTL